MGCDVVTPPSVEAGPKDMGLPNGEFEGVGVLVAHGTLLPLSIAGVSIIGDCKPGVAGRLSEVRWDFLSRSPSSRSPPTGVPGAIGPSLP